MRPYVFEGDEMICRVDFFFWRHYLFLLSWWI